VILHVHAAAAFPALRGGECIEEHFDLGDLHVQRVAGMSEENGCDLFVALSVLPPQSENGYTDDREEDEPQSLQVILQADGELLVQGGLG
jgi:hypothetical protein